MHLQWGRGTFSVESLASESIPRLWDGRVTVTRAGAGGLEPVRADDLESRLAVERPELSRIVVDPVVRVDEIEAIARAADPAETKLPTQGPDDCIVLEVADERNPWARLRVDDTADRLGREGTLGQIDLVPLAVDTQREIRSRRFPEKKLPHS